MSTYLSKQFYDFHNEKNKTYSLSIYHKRQLNNEYLKLPDVAEPIQKEIYDMISLKKDEMTFELLSKLKDQIVLVQAPDSSFWSTYHHLQPMKIVNVLEEGLELNQLNPDIPNFWERKFEGFQSWYITFQDMYNFPNKWNIWLPRKLYFEKIKNFYLQDRIRNDPNFIEYIYNPNNIIKNKTASELFVNVSMYRENIDFQCKV